MPISPFGMFLILPSAVIEFLSFHRTESNEFFEFFQFHFEQIIASSQHIINVETNHATQHTCRRVHFFLKKKKARSLLSKPDLNEHFGELLPPLARCIIQSKKLFLGRATNCQAEFLGEWGRSTVANSTKLDLCPEILPSGTLLARQLSAMSTFLVPDTDSQQDTDGFTTSGWRISPNVQHIWICVSRNHDTCRCLRVQRILSCAFAFVLSTRTNHDCITRSWKPCFLSVRQMTLASAGGYYRLHSIVWKRPQGIAASHVHPGLAIASLWIERLLRDMHRATTQTH